jgi:hypothetical protein
MNLNRNKLYSILYMACTTGYIWVYFNARPHIINTKPIEVCLIKHLTTIPCPSCGSTRSVIALTKGNFIEAISINPIGYIIAVIMIVSPLWIMIDLVCKQNTLFTFYQKTETYLKKPRYAMPLLVLVVINWFWNIAKGL